MKLPKIDHFFGKATVITCIVFIMWYVIASMNGYYNLDKEPTNLTPYIFGFFGTELCIMALKTILSSKNDKNDIDDNKGGEM